MVYSRNNNLYMQGVLTSPNNDIYEGDFKVTALQKPVLPICDIKI